jgi:hypothetical protein
VITYAIFNDVSMLVFHSMCSCQPSTFCMITLFLESRIFYITVFMEWFIVKGGHYEMIMITSDICFWNVYSVIFPRLKRQLYSKIHNVEGLSAKMTGHLTKSVSELLAYTSLFSMLVQYWCKCSLITVLFVCWLPVYTIFKNHEEK